MYALVVEELFDLLGDLHVLGKISTAYVSRSDYTIAGQLPDVKLVNSQYTVNILEKSLLNRVDLWQDCCKILDKKSVKFLFSFNYI